jgi:uncharacterized membrane protein
VITVTLYSRSDCHLCEVAYQDLLGLKEALPHELVVIDVDSTKELRRAYGFEVPVVEIGPYRLKAPFGIEELKITLAAAADRQRQIDALDDPGYFPKASKMQSWTWADRFAFWTSRHYLSLFNLFVIIYLGLPLLAPVLMNYGYASQASLIYRVYGTVCHQLAYRSFFLFGEQSVYPRAAAGVKAGLTYEQVTGFTDDNTPPDLLAARQYVGAERIGYKIALCQRDFAIYAAILLFGLVFGLTGRRLPALPWLLWLLMGIVPIAVDGLSQLLSQPPFLFLPYRESTPFYRTLTGGLFGFMTAWFGYPMVEETMRETRALMQRKLNRIQNAIPRK